MSLSLMSFEQHLNCFWSYILTFQYCGVFVEFPWFPSFSFWVQGSKRNPEITENLYFWVYRVQMGVDLCFDHYFHCLSVKTDRSKNRLNWIYPKGSKTFKTQIAAAWLAIWLNHFEIDVVWTAFQLVVKLHFHISVLRRFCRISVISEFSFLSVRLKMKTRKSRKIFSFWVIKLKCI